MISSLNSLGRNVVCNAQKISTPSLIAISPTYQYTDYNIYVFTADTVCYLPSQNSAISGTGYYLVVGGGGSGGTDQGGGGGGGQVSYGSFNFPIGVNTYNIVIGAGGVSKTEGQVLTSINNGQPSSLSMNSSSIKTALGGGVGGCFSTAVLATGYNGGGGNANSAGIAGNGGFTGGTATAGGGGGAGAGGNGGIKNGGIGVQVPNTINGIYTYTVITNNYWWGGGGGGGTGTKSSASTTDPGATWYNTRITPSGGIGGKGGGGAGGNNLSGVYWWKSFGAITTLGSPISMGIAANSYGNNDITGMLASSEYVYGGNNTGGGGGGAMQSVNLCAHGGSGIVIIALPR